MDIVYGLLHGLEGLHRGFQEEAEEMALQSGDLAARDNLEPIAPAIGKLPREQARRHVVVISHAEYIQISTRGCCLQKPADVHQRVRPIRMRMQICSPHKNIVIANSAVEPLPAPS
jgi:hypothetical protein